jgi:hypothetical protein
MASLPLACVVVAIGLVTRSSSLLDIGMAWIDVLGVLAVVVQIAVAVVNHHAARWAALPRARIQTDKPR